MFLNEAENGLPMSNTEELENRFYDTSYMHGRPLDSDFFHHQDRFEQKRAEEHHQPVADDFGFEIDEEEDNVLDLVHPASEGKDIEHKAEVKELEMIKE